MSENAVVSTRTPDSTELVIHYDITDANYTYPALDCLPASARHEDGVEWHFDQARDARLALGIWDALGSPVEVVPDAVPIKVAAAKQAVLAAYLYLAPSQESTRSREEVMDILDIQRVTLSSYFSVVRWDWPDTE